MDSVLVPLLTLVVELVSRRLDRSLKGLFADPFALLQDLSVSSCSSSSSTTFVALRSSLGESRPLFTGQARLTSLARRDPKRLEP